MWSFGIIDVMSKDQPSEPSPASGSRSGRQVGIDLARGLAVLLMVQTHAYDAWVSPAGKVSFGYRLSRMVSNIPAPLFLLLAGVGLVLGAQAAAKRAPQKSRHELRLAMARRALEVLGYGYLVSLIYAAIDWQFTAGMLLRADILHCIGLSLLLCTGMMALRTGAAWRAALIVVLGLAGCLLAGRYLPALPVYAKPLLGLLVDVPGFTRFPLLPLCGFCAIGFALGPLSSVPRRPAVYLSWCLLATVAAIIFGELTDMTLRTLGGKLSRSHPAVIWNFFDGTSRALAVLWLGQALGNWVRAEALAVQLLVRLGRGSLLAYAFHIPFCYSRLASPWAGKLSMSTATPLVLALMLLTFAAVYVRDRFKKAA